MTNFFQKVFNGASVAVTLILSMFVNQLTSIFLNETQRIYFVCFTNSLPLKGRPVYFKVTGTAINIQATTNSYGICSVLFNPHNEGLTAGNYVYTINYGTPQEIILTGNFTVAPDIHSVLYYFVENQNDIFIDANFTISAICLRNGTPEENLNYTILIKQSGNTLATQALTSDPGGLIEHRFNAGLISAAAGAATAEIYAGAVLIEEIDLTFISNVYAVVSNHENLISITDEETFMLSVLLYKNEVREINETDPPIDFVAVVDEGGEPKPYPIKSLSNGVFLKELSGATLTAGAHTLNMYYKGVSLIETYNFTITKA